MMDSSMFLYLFILLSIISILLQHKYLKTHKYISDIVVTTDSKKCDDKYYMYEPFDKATKIRNGLHKGLPFRKFNSWNESSIPCFEDYDNDRKGKIKESFIQCTQSLNENIISISVGKDLKGMIYIKIHKSSSSTLAGINLRIAHRHYNKTNTIRQVTKKDKHMNQYNDVPYCAHWWQHKKAIKLNVQHRNLSSTYLWTFLRHPTKRLLSHFWFFQEGIVQNQTIYNNDKLLKHFFESKIKYTHLNNYQLHFMNPIIVRDKGSRKYEEVVYTIALNILEHYDFIGLVERMDESLVIMQLLLNLDPGDVLYTSSKVSGNYVANLYYKCSKKIPVPKILPKPIQDHITSDTYYKDNFGDFLLYQAVNKSLDMTIEERIGREVFEKALEEHRYLMRLVEERCEDRVFSLCSKDGVEQWEIANCYKRDFGCGYPCLDEIYR